MFAVFSVFDEADRRKGLQRAPGWPLADYFSPLSILRFPEYFRAAAMKLRNRG